MVGFVATDGPSLEVETTQERLDYVATLTHIIRTTASVMFHRALICGPMEPIYGLPRPQLHLYTHHHLAPTST